jgi:hypothetical protein
MSFNASTRNQRALQRILLSLTAMSLSALLILLMNGYTAVKKTAALPVTAVELVIPGSKPVRVDPAMLQNEVLRYADEFCSQTTAALDDYASRVTSQDARLEALKWKISLNSAAVGIATGPNPVAGLLDFVSLSTLVHETLQDRAPKAVPPGALNAWLDASAVLDSNAWSLAKTVFATNQLDQIRAAIEQARATNDALGNSFFARPQELATIIRTSREQKQDQSGGVFSLVGLDPTAGLDPAVREVTRTRLFAERALFAAERAPFLLRWQSEFLTAELMRQQQISSTVDSLDRISKAAETTSQTMAILPDRITEERKAILDALQQQEGKLRDLAAEINQSLVSADKMSTSLNATLTTFDGLMKRFGVGEPSTSPPSTNSQPFNILDYGKTAEQIAAMSEQLDKLIKDTSGTVDSPAIDKRIASLNDFAEKTKADAKSVLNHAFLLVAGLIVLTFACAIGYRKACRNPRAEKSQG